MPSLSESPNDGLEEFSDTGVLRQIVYEWVGRNDLDVEEAVEEI